MASFIRNIRNNVSYILIFFLSFTNATPEEDMEICINHAADFCINEKSHPEAIACVQTMIKCWMVQSFPPGPLATYYYTVTRRLNHENIPTRHIYCQKFPEDYKNCVAALIHFGDSTEFTLVHAVYDTTTELCSTNYFASAYMDHLISLIPEILGDVLPPWEFCKRKYFPNHIGTFNWTPYEHTDEEEDEESIISEVESTSRE